METDHHLYTRRGLLHLIFGASVVLLQSQPALADDSKNGDGGDTSGGTDGKNGDDDGGGEDDSGSSSGFASQGGAAQNLHFPIKPAREIGRVLNQDEIKTAISSGNAATLPLLLAYLNINYPGKVLDVKLRAIDKSYVYEVKLLSKAVFLHTVMLDAKTMKKF